MPDSLDYNIFQLVVTKHPNSDTNTLVTEYYKLLKAKKIIESGVATDSYALIEVNPKSIDDSSENSHKDKVYKTYTEADIKYKDKDYISDDKIICCLCGDSFKSLYKHLDSIHKCSVSNYKQLCGFPKDQILGSLQYQKDAKERGRKLYENRKAKKKTV